VTVRKRTRKEQAKKKRRKKMNLDEKKRKRGKDRRQGKRANLWRASAKKKEGCLLWGVAAKLSLIRKRGEKIIKKKG